jgi:hypothetical protein
MKKSVFEQKLEQILKQSEENFTPSASVYKKIMDEIKQDIANPASPRYLSHQESSTGGFPSLKEFSINFITTMQKLKYILPAVVVVIIIVAVGYGRFGQSSIPSTQVPSSPQTVANNNLSSGQNSSSVNTTPQAPMNNNSPTPTVSYPPATGNADDIANELNADADQQASIESEGDAADQQAVTNTTQYINNLNGESNAQ